MLTESEQKTLYDVAKSLGAKPDSLYALMKFESGLNPSAKNKKTGAMGLIQFTNTTARGLGYASAEDLVAKNPTFELQMRNPVKKLLAPYGSYGSDQELFMAVFYPRARGWSPLKEFPEDVQRLNAPIKTPQDYIDLVHKTVANDKYYDSLKTQLPNIGSASPLWIIIPASGILTYAVLKFIL
jgi:hypothetical protein